MLTLLLSFIITFTALLTPTPTAKQMHFLLKLLYYAICRPSIEHEEQQFHEKKPLLIGEKRQLHKKESHLDLNLDEEQYFAPPLPPRPRKIFQEDTTDSVLNPNPPGFANDASTIVYHRLASPDLADVSTLLHKMAVVMWQHNYADTSPHFRKFFSQEWDTVKGFALIQDDDLTTLLCQSVEQFEAHVNTQQSPFHNFSSFVSTCANLVADPADWEEASNVTTRLTRLFTLCTAKLTPDLWPSCWFLFTYNVPCKGKHYLAILMQSGLSEQAIISCFLKAYSQTHDSCHRVALEEAVEELRRAF
ncbi:MAG: hypothetical protein M1835_007031 [Candelina submexicana]|nr:MAG: hypothetical protein M1835_007031 [Candelina submexicana]